MDCLIEQTHPEIRKRDDVDVSVDLIRSTFVQLITHLYTAEEINMAFVFFYSSSDTQTFYSQNRRYVLFLNNDALLSTEI